jgi:hypothetical protein
MPAFLLLVVLVMAGAYGLAMLQNRRIARSESMRTCYRCSEALSADAAFRIEGRLYCLRCSRALGRRIRVAFWGVVGILTLFLAVTVSTTVSALRAGDADWWRSAAWSVGLSLLLVGQLAYVMWYMRRTNRLAEDQVQLATAAEVLRNDET